MTDAKDRQLIKELRQEIQKQSMRVHHLRNTCNQQMDVIKNLHKELKGDGALTEVNRQLVVLRAQMNQKNTQVYRLSAIIERYREKHDVE